MRSPVRSILVHCLSLALALPALASAAGAESPLADRVAERAHQHLLAEARSAGFTQLRAQITAVLPRGAQPADTACAQPIDIEILDGRFAGRMLLAAACGGAQPWRAEFVVRASISARVAVAAADIESGRPIEQTDLALERRELTAGTLADLESIVGKSLRRALRSGDAIESRWLHEPTILRRGDAVTIVARRSGVEAQVAGEALQSGRRDEVVRVRNKATGKVIRARIVDATTVEPVLTDSP